MEKSLTLKTAPKSAAEMILAIVNAEGHTDFMVCGTLDMDDRGYLVQYKVL